jgi:hypothetical protein
LIVCKVVLISHKSHVVRNVLFLHEVLNVKSEIHHSLLKLISVIVGNQEASRDLVDNSSWKSKLLLDLGVRVVSLSLKLLVKILILKNGDTKEGVVNFVFLVFLVKVNLDCVLSHVELINSAHDTKELEI